MFPSIESSVLLSPLASRRDPFAPSGFHRLSSLLWAPPTPIPSSPECYCLPRRSLQLDPSLGRVSQVPGCSFRARRPTLPRKVLLELSVIFSLSGVGFLSVEDLGHFHLFSFRGFHTPGSLSLRLTLSHPRGSSRLVSHSTALAASSLMTLYMANSFYLARTTKSLGAPTTSTIEK
jgi:hypothetical protein